MEVLAAALDALLTMHPISAEFFRAPDGDLAAAAIDATAAGLCRQLIPSTGLAGWTWHNAVAASGPRNVSLGFGQREVAV